MSMYGTVSVRIHGYFKEMKDENATLTITFRADISVIRGRKKTQYMSENISHDLKEVD